MSSSLSSSSRPARTRAIPPYFVLHVLFAATALFSPRVVSAAGTTAAVEDAVFEHDTNNNAEQGVLQGGGALAWAAETVESAVGSVEKTVRDAVSGILEAEERNVNHEVNEEVNEEEVVVASAPDVSGGVTAVAAADAVVKTGKEDFDSYLNLVNGHVDGELDESTNETAETHAIDDDDDDVEEGPKSEEVVFEEMTTSTIFYEDDGGSGGGGTEKEESGEESYLIIVTTSEEEDDEQVEQRNIPPVTTTTTTTTTSSSTTVTTTRTAAEEEEDTETSVTLTMMTETTTSSGETVSIDGDLDVFSISGDDTADTIADRIAVITANNGIDIGGDDVPTYDELLLLEVAETRPHHQNIFEGGIGGMASIAWEGDEWPGNDGVVSVSPLDSVPDIEYVTALDDDTSLFANFVRFLMPSPFSGAVVDQASFSRRLPRPSSASVALIFIDDQWPTPMYTTRWVYSIDLIGFAICALSLIIVFILIFGLTQDDEEEHEEYDEERGGVSPSDVVNNKEEEEYERESLLDNPKSVAPFAKGNEFGKGPDIEYVQEPPVWTNPCPMWANRQ